MNLIQRILVYVGNTLTVIGCVGLVLGALGVIDPEVFAFGISSGVRVIGSVAIVGCLVSAISYGILELQERQLSRATTTKG
jgi:hydroxyethylthiazole kinase-like sugar kinase family protein